MRIRNFAALLLTVITLALQVVTAQAMLESETPTQVDKFPDLSEENTLPLPAVNPEDSDAIQIDRFTGEELGSKNSEVGGNRVTINNTVAYDREKRAYVYYVGNDEVFSNAASGMILAEPVWLTIPDGIVLHLYKNGKLLENANISNISEPGAYTLTGDEVTNSTEIMHFTIVSSITGQLSRFQVPDGFVISTALLNGGKISAARTYVDLTTEGDYDISYRCPVTEGVYMFRITVDHTPPVLALAEIRDDGTSKGPVDISDLEEGAQIGIWLDNEKISYEPVLTRSGRYRIVVTDAAGNMSTYNFMIRIYYNTNSMIFFAAILAIGLGVGIYALYSRRHVRIR